MKAVFAVCGSFCNHAQSIKALEALVSEGHDLYPVISEISASTDTRFGTCESLKLRVGTLCGREPIYTIRDAEQMLTPQKFDALVICPCTGNTLAKISCGITDSVVTMSAKIAFRNRVPVVIALATNDALGMTLRNIAETAVRKGVYFVPLRQDSPKKKPDSLICEFDMLRQTLECATDGVQIQPVLL